MGNQRQYVRTECESQCVLMDLDGNTYKALLENISLGGAMVTMSDGIPQSLKIGDVCDLLLCNDPELCPAKNTCRVVRHTTAHIGVTFLTTRDQ